MSKFLAPIHSWLFNKIVIHEDLEKDIESAFKSKYGDEVSNIINNNIDKYGPRLKSDNVEDIIDESNIHGWLQENIGVAETRQAGILGDLFNKYNDEAIDLARDVYIENAILNANAAKENKNFDSAEDIYKTINDYLLDGMPCDSASNITKSSADFLESVNSSCLHINYWETAKVDPDIMYDLRAQWTSAFVSELNPRFKYSRVDSISTIKKM